MTAISACFFGVCKSTPSMMGCRGLHPIAIHTKEIDIWLVAWNMNFMTFHILGMSSSQLTNSYFSEGVGIPPTRYEWCSNQMTKLRFASPKSTIYLSSSKVQRIWEVHQALSTRFTVSIRWLLTNLKMYTG